MVDSLHNLIAAQGDAIIPNLAFDELSKPSASYVIDRRSTRVPFLAPIYSPANVQVARAVIADPGFVDPRSLYLVAEVHNTSDDDDARLVPLTSSLHGAFQRGRLLSGQVIEDILEYSRVGEILHKLKPPWAQEEESKMGFPFIT